MAEFKLGRIRFVWKDEWVPGTTYLKDDVVRVNGKVYICVIGHTADTDFYVDEATVPTKWNQASDGQTWRGDWVPSEIYYKNDIVKYGGQVYICLVGHTAAADYSSGLEADLDLGDSTLTKWDQFAESFDWKGDWTTGVRYKLNDIVKYGGNTYLCNVGHTSAATAAQGLEGLGRVSPGVMEDIGKWDIYSEAFDWKTDWAPSTRYKLNDVVKFGGTTYVCNEGHTSGADFTAGLEADQSKWDYFNQGFEYLGAWDNDNIDYKINDLVKYGGGIWICIQKHTSDPLTTFEADETSGYWEKFLEGLQFEDSWNSATVYQPGDIVTYGGYAYVSRTNHSNVTPTDALSGSTNWDLFTTAFKFQQDWDVATDYKVGDVVRLSGYTYVAIEDNTGQTPPDLTYWEQLNPGIRWLNTWTSGYSYVLGDAVRYGPNSYICVDAHTSTSGSDRPDNDVSGLYWNLLANGQESSVLTTQGDLVYYGGAGPTRLPIGRDGQVLTVGGSAAPTWEYWGQIDQLYYVGLEGADEPAPSYGVTLDKPWRTVRYAAQQIEKGARNPDAAELIRRNRLFIQKETIGWINNQISSSTAPFVSGFVYDQTKCERDVGFVVDSIVWDLTHGGNIESRKTALQYVQEAPAIYSLGQKEETVAAIEYAVEEVLLKVITNTAPTSSYQVVVNQYTNVDLVAESTVTSEVSSLESLITTAITGGTLGSVGAEVRPQRTILIKTGVFYEVLPIIVPVDTAIVGDELRSTNIRPAGQLIDPTDSAKTVEAYGYLKTLMSDVVSGTPVASPEQLTVAQFTDLPAGSVGSTTAATSVVTNIDTMYNVINLETTTATTTTDPTGYNTSFLAGYGDARAQLVANKSFIQNEITSWIAYQVTNNISPFTTSFTYDSAACSRDVGYIVDSLIYDLTYGGNLETIVSARSYFSLGIPVYGSGEKDEVIAAYTRLKDVVGYVITENTSWTKYTSLVQDTSGTAGTATFAQARVDEILAALTADTADGIVVIEPSTSWVDADLVASAEALVALKTEIAAHAQSHIKKFFPTLVYDIDLCSRDVGYMIDALAYDLMFAGNFRSVRAADAYLRGLSSTAVVLADQKDAILDMLSFLGYKVKYIAANGAEAQATILWDDVIDALTGLSLPPTAGRSSTISDGDTIVGAYMLLANKDFLAAEAVAYIENAYPSYTFDGVACARDAREFVDAIANDILKTGNYNTSLAARYYINAATTSVQENMYLVRNASGIRNQTVQGLTGTLGTANAYGTSRPTAGAYVSLDPGWGPDDERAWTTNKSCYVQNVTTFGTACVGCKIDGALHSGGNKSIVSNDFTQVLSDGIGVWCTNLARTELVSVFSYYGHIGYLAENGGKIRATNGNSSYGTFGTVAEGADPYEVPITAAVNNYYEQALITKTLTDTVDEIFAVEYSNAGRNYTEATFQFNGPGSGVSTLGQEIRDGGVFELHLQDLNDSSGQFGGLDYLTNENVAQGGSTSSITIAATDDQTSSAYVGMRIYIQSGTGVGQYGYIGTYNAGSKIATILKESTGTAGWDHVVPGTTIVAPDPSSLYIIEPRVTATAPTDVVKTVSGSLPGYSSYDSVIYANTQSTHTGVSQTSTTGVGSGATFNVDRDGLSYTVTINVGGTNYANNDEIVISGADVDGTVSTNDITVKVLTVDEITGEVLTIEWSGVGRGGNFIAGAGSYYSKDGTTWQASTTPPPDTFGSLATGNISGITYSVFAGNGTTVGAYSTDGGVNWTQTNLPAGGTVGSIAYGNGRFIGVYETTGTQTLVSTNGTTWASGANPLPASAYWIHITYGQGKFLAIANGGETAYSTDGITWTAGGDLPGASASWNTVAYGNNLFVASGSDGVGGYISAVSNDSGATWIQSLNNSGSRTGYGQGLFVSTSGAAGTGYWTSYDGLTWTAKTTTTVQGDVTKPVFGNPNRQPTWILTGQTGNVTRALTIGNPARIRARVVDTKIIEFRISEPGTGYTSAPTVTITDPNNTYNAPFEVRIGDGVLAQPTFINRGIGWEVATASVTGDGHADILQYGNYIDVKGLYEVPIPGSNVEFASLPGQFYKLVTVTQLLGAPGPYTARLQISPPLEVSEAPAHLDDVTVRLRYSQVRLTGHDFLDIGTGDFTNTNYPNLPLQDPQPTNETVESNGGRVFYTSTDQDGNFRVGGLFTVEQSTGTATLNADAFNIAGLQELSLGSVELGTGGATITEFSTDPFFTQDSDSVIPTQRAIKAYIASQIGSGSSTLNVNTLTAGSVYVANDYITTTTGGQINVTAKLNFIGGVDGIPVAMNLFLHG